MTFSSFETWWWPYLFILLAAALPTAIWRWLGVFSVGDLADDSPWLLLVRCVATSLVAAVVAQIVFFPTGALAEVTAWGRVGSAFIGFAAYLAAGRRMIVGVAVGETALIASWLLSTLP